MHPDLEKLVSRGKIEADTARQLSGLEPGTFCVHKSWGVGAVREWDRLNLKVTVDFEEKSGHELSMKFAALSLSPVEADSFYAKRFSSLEELQNLAKEDPVALIVLAIGTQADNKIHLDRLEEMVKGHVVADGKYRSWWEGAKKRLREDNRFIVPPKRNEPLEMRGVDFDPSEGLIEDFRNARDLKAKVKAVEAIIKDIGVFKEHQDRLHELVEEISDTARKGARLQFTAAVELFLIGEELMQKLRGYEPPEGLTKTADVLAENEEAVPALLEELSLTRLRQVLRAFPEAFGDESTAKMLALVPHCNLRSIGEIANYLDSVGERDAFIGYFSESLQQRTLSSDGLAWICRERKGIGGPLFGPELSLNVMSSLESDQLNEEGAVRAANRLRDIVASDRSLIQDLIADSNLNTIRNFAGRLINSASFDDLTRKSLVARIIKQHPEVQELLGRGDKKHEETLIVSEESYIERKAAYDRLVREEIPQNREDIKVARSYGDLRENFEYKSAKEYQRVLMKRQQDWERDLKLAQPTDFAKPDTSKVTIGTVVELEPTDGTGGPLTYSVLGAWDSDPEKGVIAYLSERGREILGKGAGDEVEFPVGDGTTKRYRICSIRGWRS